MVNNVNRENFPMCRRKCFGNRNDDHVCTCLKVAEDNCKFFKSPDQLDYELAHPPKKRMRIIRTGSAVMYY